jgi:cupin 2 domain-containing protein
MRVLSGNLFADMPISSSEELFTDLLRAPGVKIERIVSTGQATPASQWLDQEWVEWVALLSGVAGVLFDGEAHPRVLKPGDWLEIPAHARHRVEWTDASAPTVWLAIHIQSSSRDG